ncbi:hypothetical protein E1281_11630 [Actinomadura sp. KC345]|uniref:PIN domain-containing protein n=1 Tax=Actinomadura sp. KC345 TaxID=2530371 RepID=UPI001045B291|nr:PIN domain-containing protein [Actinomadura sp. KC345]TDC55630.1 hypothetical protein E1281_11630 [Actinomadura sp. KC345]
MTSDAGADQGVGALRPRQGRKHPIKLLVSASLCQDLAIVGGAAKLGAPLTRRAATAIRYLECFLKDNPLGQPVPLRRDATLELWVNTDNRGDDADLAILDCAAELNNLHRVTGARVLTGDLGMRLRAQHLGVQALHLPEEWRKKGTALDDAPPQQATETR